VGEIYEIDPELLPDLDRYEDSPALYRRVATTIAGHNVQVYVLQADRAAGRPCVPGGDWCSKGS
jgi:gamma-glutamylcyclotransferase (GGCT)/AIG2-like uncharacterized protein YtfP